MNMGMNVHRNMKKTITALAGLTLSGSVGADICSYAPDIDMDQLQGLLKGKYVVDSDPMSVFPIRADAIRGIVVEIKPRAGDTTFDLVVSATGKNDGSEQTIYEADLGFMMLICPNGRPHDLAGALKKSKFLCAKGEAIRLIGDSEVDINCN